MAGEKTKQEFWTEAVGAVNETRSSMALMDAMSLLRSQKSSANDVASAIQFDPVLTEHIITEVNSPFYGLRNKVETLQHAISLLGFKRIQQLLSTSSTHSMYANVENSYFEMTAFKRHGVAVGCMAEQMAIKLRLANTPEFYQAGVMHDIGKYMYLTKFSDQFRKLIDQGKKSPEPMIVLERQILGTDHCELGLLMAEAWGIPEQIRAPIRYHHGITPEEKTRLTTRETALVELVTFANLLAHGTRVGGESAGTRVDMKNLPPPPGVLTDADIKLIIELSEKQYTEAIKEMGL